MKKMLAFCILLVANLNAMDYENFMCEESDKHSTSRECDECKGMALVEDDLCSSQVFYGQDVYQEEDDESNHIDLKTSNAYRNCCLKIEEIKQKISENRCVDNISKMISGWVDEGESVIDDERVMEIIRNLTVIDESLEKVMKSDPKNIGEKIEELENDLKDFMPLPSDEGANKDKVKVYHKKKVVKKATRRKGKK